MTVIKVFPFGIVNAFNYYASALQDLEEAKGLYDKYYHIRSGVLNEILLITNCPLLHRKHIAQLNRGVARAPINIYNVQLCNNT